MKLQRAKKLHICKYFVYFRDPKVYKTVEDIYLRVLNLNLIEDEAYRDWAIVLLKFSDSHWQKASQSPR